MHRRCRSMGMPVVASIHPSSKCTVSLGMTWNECTVFRSSCTRTIYAAWPRRPGGACARVRASAGSMTHDDMACAMCSCSVRCKNHRQVIRRVMFPCSFLKTNDHAQIAMTPSLRVNHCDVIAPQNVSSVQVMRDVRMLKVNPSAPHTRARLSGPARVSGVLRRTTRGRWHTHALLQENDALARRALNIRTCTTPRAKSCSFAVRAPVRRARSQDRGVIYKVRCENVAWLPSPSLERIILPTRPDARALHSKRLRRDHAARLARYHPLSRSS